MKLREKIADLKTPEVYWHEQLQNLGYSQFNSGHLKDKNAKMLFDNLLMNSGEAFLKILMYLKVWIFYRKN